MNKNLLLLLFILTLANHLTAGNPDRQGEAGASELNLNPWARGLGFGGANTATVTGVEAMFQNIAGLSRVKRTEVGLGYSAYLAGTGLSISTGSVAQKVGENGAFGVNISALNFGKTAVTTANQPEGTGATFSPTFINIGIGYAHTFENKVSVGINAKGISETLSDATAFGLALDAGVQYVAGSDKYPEQFKFGITLRNIGSRISFGGDGLNVALNNPNNGNYQVTYQQRAAGFELPSQLHIGASYDLLPNKKNRLTLLGNFTSNSFSRDVLAGSLEYAMNDVFSIRGSYQKELQGSTNADDRSSVYTGLSGGISVQVPFSKDGETKLAIDYGYATTNPFKGTHNLALRLNF